jgi:hypothetical protein
MLLAVAAVAAASAGAEPSYLEKARRAALELCPGFIRGAVSEADVSAKDHAGFHRLPDYEAHVAAKRGGERTVAFGGETGGNLLFLAWSPKYGQCQVTFKGPEASKATDAVRAGLAAAASGYVRSPNSGNPAAGFPNAFVYRSTSGTPALKIKLYLPAPDDASQSYVVEINTAQPA